MPVDARLYRHLPSLDDLLRSKGLTATIACFGRAAVAEAARTQLDSLRGSIERGEIGEASLAEAVSGLASHIEAALQGQNRFSLQTVINATGVVLHTNLGRAPLAREALAHAEEMGAAYSNLEFDLETGARGKRDGHTQSVLDRLFAAYAYEQDPVASIVVNNCAAAVLLALNTLAEGGEVVVSRGELVEIGGSFRIPDVMAKSGAVLREVGTTNRTRIADYANAIHDRTRLILRVHRSNFSIVGFTEQPSLEQLVALGRERKIPVMEDLGNGALMDLRDAGIEGEPGVRESLKAGADLVCYSGDKLLGGPQAGLISGRKPLVERLRANPLFRALRVDKLTIAVLEATLLAALRQDYDAVPALRMMRLEPKSVRTRAEALATELLRATDLHVSVEEGSSLIGGGTAPNAVLPTWLLKVAREGTAPEELLARLRRRPLPVIARAEGGSAVLDLRTVFPEQDAAVLEALKALAHG